MKAIEPYDTNPQRRVTKALIEDFKSWISMSTSKETRESYASTLSKYCLNKEVGSLNRKDFFIELSSSLQGRGLSLNTVMRHTFAVKKFLIFLNEKYEIPIINLSVIRCKKPPKQNPTYLELHEIVAIRQVPVQTIIELRDRALFEFLLYSGCRISEALGIQWQKIDFNKGEVEVLGKGSKKRIVFLNESKLWLMEYLSNRNSEHPSLFISQYKSRPLNREHAAIAIKKLAQRAGLTKHVHPHLLRHTFATYLIWAGVDPRTVQEMMGHEDLETTLKYYSAVTQDRMRAANSSFGDFLGATATLQHPEPNMDPRVAYPMYKKPF